MRLLKSHPNLNFIGVGKKRLLFLTFHFIIVLRYLVKYGYFVKGFVECQSPNVRSIEVKFRNLSFHTFKYLEFT